MAKAIALLVGIILGLHGLIGLFIEGEHLLGVLNVDLILDLLYLALAGMLVFTGTLLPSSVLTRGPLLIAGGVLLLLVLIGLADRTVLGMLPTGLTLLDMFLMGATGFIAGAAAVLPGTDRPLTSAGAPLN